MKIRTNLAVVAAAITITLAGVAGHTQGLASEQKVLKRFHQSVSDYAALHRQLEKGTPPVSVSSHTQEIFQAADALAAAIQSARISAREGDIFTADVAGVLRSRLVKTLGDRGLRASDVVAASNEEAPPDAAWPVVNGRFPWSRGAAMWPCILNALPALPRELHYRIVDHDLVLIDTEADLVVDILRNALSSKGKK